MCLFPRFNNAINSVAYKRGLRFFDCGACPECLSSRTRKVVLACAMESSTSLHSCMVTLTYDNYKRDASGKIIGELPPDTALKCEKRDIQLFMKRLRKKYSGTSIKYYCTAEYGSRTGRAHYHALLFGVDFSEDAVFYKKSKRGNFIYTSRTLTKLWNHGICTVDKIGISPSTASYCSKYTSKSQSRSANPFSLRSHHLGLKAMLESFNGLYYVIEGVKYPIPRTVWNHYIESKYSKEYALLGMPISSRYIPMRKVDGVVLNRSEYDFGCYLRSNFRAVRDSDPLYLSYIAYWRRVAEETEQRRPSILNRILALDLSRFGAYRERAKIAYARKKKGLCYQIPWSNSKYGTFLPTPAFCPPFHSLVMKRQMTPKPILREYYMSKADLKIFNHRGFVQESFSFLKKE